MIHPLAVIGEPPEHRDWVPGMDIYPPDISQSARIEALVTVDAGMFRDTSIGPFSWLMKKVHVGHDARIGMSCEIAPLTSVGGEVEIGDRVKIGQGVTIKPRIIIGSDAVIGMGAVVTKNVPAGETWVGNPARRLKGKRLVFSDERARELVDEGWEIIAKASQQ
jgi:UDP-N-acetylglucosamine acyltransferase